MSAGGLRHVVISQGGRNRLVSREGFVTESLLQGLVHSSPELLGPLGEDLAFLPVGYEVLVGNGRRLDLLFLDSQGVPTLIETKLRANDESRREVIGQVLEYAMAIDAWSPETFVANATSFLASSPDAPVDLRGRSFDDAAATRFAWKDDAPDELSAKLDALKSKLAANLSGGRLRIVVGVDEHIEGLERLVQYFSAHSDLQVVLLQVNQFPVDDQLRVLIPTLHGDVGGGVSRPAGGAQVRMTRDALLEAHEPGAEREAVRQLLDGAQRAGAAFEWGPSGVSVRARTPLVGQPVTVAWVYAPDRPGWMRTRDCSFGHALVESSPPARLQDLLDRYVAQLATAKGVDASSKGVVAWSFSPAQLASHPELSVAMHSLLREIAATKE